MRRRLDRELLRRGLCGTPAEAEELIRAGRVRVSGAPGTNPGRLVSPGEPVVLEPEPSRWVGRGALKLDAALDHFGLDPAGARVLDAGASTGGFTDVLLQRGAAEVVAVDVGHGQLHERIRSDQRVVVMERTNLRYLEPDRIGPFDAVVADLSFISLVTVMEVLVACTAPSGWLVLLVKPQFEVPRAVAARERGVITDPAEWTSALHAVLDAAVDAGARPCGLIPSPVRGAAGNVEFLLHLERSAGQPLLGTLHDVVDSAVTAATDRADGPL